MVNTIYLRYTEILTLYHNVFARNEVNVWALFHLMKAGLAGETFLVYLVKAIVELDVVFDEAVILVIFRVL